MWSRAKRTGKGERLDEAVWTKMAGKGGEVLVNAAGSSTASSEGSDDDDEMAYASDTEDKAQKVKTK